MTRELSLHIINPLLNTAGELHVLYFRYDIVDTATHYFCENIFMLSDEDLVVLDALLADRNNRFVFMSHSLLLLK